MNWEDKTSELLEWAMTVLQTTQDFAIEQAPIVVQEFYMWFIAHHIFYIVLGVLLVGVTYVFHKLGVGEDKHKWGNDMYFHTDGAWVGIPLLTGVISLVFLLTNIYYLAMILVAPRIYLINKLTQWIN